MWARGLKLAISRRLLQVAEVAPRVGAWIETLYADQYFPHLESRLVWARGLKPVERFLISPSRKSRLVWARGLKRVLLDLSISNLLVAPRVGAWIETPKPYHGIINDLVAPRVGAWIETQL